MNWDTEIYLGTNGKAIGPMTMTQLRSVHDDINLFEAAQREDAFILFDADEGWLTLPDALERIQSVMPAFFADATNAAPQGWSPPPVPASPAASTRFCCPNCGAESIARARVIYEQGTVRGATSSGEYYYDAMAQTMRSTGNQEYTTSTDLAARLAPPEGMPMGCLWPLFLLGAVPGLFLGGPIGAGVLGVIALFGVPIAYNVLIRRPEMAKYERLWYCFRCGSAWYR